MCAKNVQAGFDGEMVLALSIISNYGLKHSMTKFVNYIPKMYVSSKDYFAHFSLKECRYEVHAAIGLF